jgi:hypothetical protein
VCQGETFGDSSWAYPNKYHTDETQNAGLREIKKGQENLPFFVHLETLLLKKCSERIHEDEDQDNDESVNCE